MLAEIANNLVNNGKVVYFLKSLSRFWQKNFQLNTEHYLGLPVKTALLSQARNHKFVKGRLEPCISV